jgi:hypothetical protein
VDNANLTALVHRAEQLAAQAWAPRSALSLLNEKDVALAKYRTRLFLDSRVLADQQLNERAQQRFTPLSHVVNELEKTQVEWQFLLGNAPMRAQPTAQ